MREVKGHIELLGLLEFLQVAAFNHRSLVLMLDNPVGEGYLVLQDGEVVDALLGPARGVGALFPLLQASVAGTFRILPPPAEAPQRTINLRTDAILMRLVANLPPPGEAPACDASWRIEGNTCLLSPAEILQIFEASKKPAVCDFEEGGAGTGAVHLELAEGGIVLARARGRSGVDAVYPLFASEDARFNIVSPASPPRVERMFDIAAVVMEGLRRLDEEKLLRGELAGEGDPHAGETLARLQAGELDEASRLALARRYLPGGEVAPAFVVARLTVDASAQVRQAAMETLHDLPLPVVRALANDPETPPPLLAYMLLDYGKREVETVVLANASLPVEALVRFAPRAGPGHLEVLRKQTARLRQSRDLRAALRDNPQCDFPDLLDELERAAAPRLRKRSFSGVFPKVDAGLVLERPATDPRKEKPGGRLSVRDIQYLAKRGTLREKMDLVCGNDDEVATQIVSQPGIPESFILAVAESSAANAAALRAIAGQRACRRNGAIMRALVNNPKTPVNAAVGLLPLLRPDEISKIAGNRDIPDGTRQGARQILQKRQKRGGR